MGQGWWWGQKAFVYRRLFHWFQGMWSKCTSQATNGFESHSSFGHWDAGQGKSKHMCQVAAGVTVIDRLDHDQLEQDTIKGKQYAQACIG